MSLHSHNYGHDCTASSFHLVKNLNNKEKVIVSVAIYSVISSIISSIHIIISSIIYSSILTILHSLGYRPVRAFWIRPQGNMRFYTVDVYTVSPHYLS